MSDDWTLDQIEDFKNQVWNDAIDAAAEEVDKRSHILLPLRERIKNLKKPSTSNISKSLDDAIINELANPPKSLLKE